MLDVVRDQRWKFFGNTVVRQRIGFRLAALMRARCCHPHRRESEPSLRIHFRNGVQLSGPWCIAADPGLSLLDNDVALFGMCLRRLARRLSLVFQRWSAPAGCRRLWIASQTTKPTKLAAKTSTTMSSGFMSSPRKCNGLDCSRRPIATYGGKIFLAWKAQNYPGSAGVVVDQQHSSASTS